jgi:hypothetical protein
MEKYIQPLCIFFFSLLAVLFSCATPPPAKTPGPEIPPPAAEMTEPEIPLPPAAMTEPETAPLPAEKPPVPPVPELILGKGIVEPEKLVAFLERVNPQADGDFVLALAKIYVEEAAVEDVNHDIAFAQMCLETGFLRFGGLVKPDMNNFCGLGALGPDQPGEQFPDPRTGVRAHIQHLKAYASNEPLKQTLVDPRYRWVRYGSVPRIQDLVGTWAVDKEYGNKIRSLLEQLYHAAFGEIG